MTEVDHGGPLSVAEQEATLRLAFRRILPVMFVASVICFVDRANLSYAQLGMAEDLSITAAAYGTVASAFFVAYFIFEVPSNMLLRRFGSRLWMTRIMVSWGVVTVLTGFVTSVPMLYAARFALGVAEAGFFPGMVLYLTFWFRARERSVAMGVFMVAQPIAYIIAGAISGLIIDHADWYGLASWRWIFVLTGVPAILFAFVVWKTLPDSPATAPWLNSRARAWMVASVEDERGVDTHHGGARAELAALKDLRVAQMSAVFLLFGVGFYGFTLYLPQILRQVNPSYSATNIGFVSAVPWICGAIGVLLSARLASSVRLQPVVTASALVALAGGMAGVMIFSEQPSLALVAMCVASIGTFGFIPSAWSLTTVRLSTAHAVVGIAAINSFGNLGGWVGPRLVGKFTDGTSVTSGLLFPVFSVGLALVVLTWFVVSSRPAAQAVLEAQRAAVGAP